MALPGTILVTFRLVCFCKVAYTQTGRNALIDRRIFVSFFLAGLPSSLQLKKFVPIMITVNSTTKRYKENGMTIMISKVLIFSNNL